MFIDLSNVLRVVGCGARLHGKYIAIAIEDIYEPNMRGSRAKRRRKSASYSRVGASAASRPSVAKHDKNAAASVF